MLILDTSVLIDIEKGNKETINKIIGFRKYYSDNLSITSAVYAEFLFGFIKIGKEKEAEKYIETLDVFDFDLKAAKIFAETKIHLEKKGMPIPIFDLITACIVVAKRGTLVTYDKHFENIPNLDVVLL